MISYEQRARFNRMDSQVTELEDGVIYLGDRLRQLEGAIKVHKLLVERVLAQPEVLAADFATAQQLKQ